MSISTEHIEASNGSSASSKVIYHLARILAVVAVLVGLWRLLSRPGIRFFDFAVHYTGTVAWAQGKNPYFLPYLRDWWANHGAIQIWPQIGNNLLLVLPSTLAIMSPISLLPPTIAWWCWIVFNIVLYVWAVRAAGVVAGLQWKSTGGCILVAIAATWGPFISGNGNPTIPAATLMVIAIERSLRQKNTSAGIALGIACCFKTQLALPLLILYFYLRRWRIGGLAVLIFVLVSFVAILRLQTHAPDWRQHWISNLDVARAPGGPTDFIFANPTRDHLVNIESALYSICPYRTFVQWVGPAIVLLLALLLAIEIRHAKPPNSPLIFIAAAGLCAMPVYHRYYDTLPLLLAAAWAIASVSKRGAVSWIILAFLVPYLLPVGWQTNLVRHHFLPSGVQQTWAWQTFIMPLPAWVLLGVVILLLYSLSVERTLIRQLRDHSVGRST